MNLIQHLYLRYCLMISRFDCIMMNRGLYKKGSNFHTFVVSRFSRIPCRDLQKHLQQRSHLQYEQTLMVLYCFLCNIVTSLHFRFEVGEITRNAKELIKIVISLYRFDICNNYYLNLVT